ncbi:MAG: type II toxin-antitoxin system RelE/ParE family toxin [Planctomycetes bacterium]|nr:type II toxin-antitoxin system RelE/ParE family toxin [Planctomycetota bacterium]
MVEVIWTEPAVQDLEGVAEYIVLEKPLAANHLVAEVLSKVENLRAHPRMGKCPQELPASQYRELTVPPCRIFYRQEKNIVYILHVMRGERLLRAYLLEQR